MSGAGNPRLAARAIVKTFGRNRALRGVDLVVGDGEVHGLIGENGAGKSTLLNIISGVLPFDEGVLELDGRPVAPRTYQEANRLGIFRVFQDPALVDSLAVYENMFFGWEHLFRRGGALSRPALRRASERALADAGVPDLDVRRPMGRLSPGLRQTVDIARVTALARMLEIERPVVLFDEPTTALDHEHEENFLRLLERLRGHASVVFVSHRLAEIVRTSDRITVLKDGEKVGELGSQGVDESELHRLMVGRVRTENYYRERDQREPEPAARPRLRLEAARCGLLRSASLTVAPGEILGVAGTEGSGKRELGELIAGIRPPEAGSVSIDGRRLAGGIPGHVRAGIVYVPADRQLNGLIGGASIADNIELASLHDRFATRIGGIWRRDAARAAAQRFVDELGIVATGIDAPISSLSGGNQQKVLIAKWLLREPSVLVLDTPTQGVDTGAREGIYDLIRRVADRGTAVVLISDDLPEVIGLSNRIAVLVNGRLTHSVDAPAHAKPAEHELVALMIPGGEPALTNG